MKRTQEEIAARIAVLDNGGDWMGVQRSDLMEWQDYASAKPSLKPEVTEEVWLRATKDRKEPLDEIKTYLHFAWDKANSHRGLSAGRSLDHLKAWLWLAGVDDVSDLDRYTHYGKKHLTAASYLVGVDPLELDDGNWVSSEDAPPASAGHCIDEREAAKVIAEAWKAAVNA